MPLLSWTWCPLPKWKKITPESRTDCDVEVALDRAIGSILERQNPPETLEELRKDLKTQVPNGYLGRKYHDRIADLFVKHDRARIKRIETALGTLRNRVGSQGSPASHNGQDVQDAGRSVPVDPLNDETDNGEPNDARTITIDQNCEPFYYKPLDPAHPGPTTTFTAKMCPQESNFISESAVGRLKRWNLGSADGTRYRLYGELEQESKPRWATFIVVPNSAMNIEVALGTGWAVEDSQEDRDDILSSQPSHDHPLRREEIRSRLDIQDQGQSPQITAYSTHLPSDRQVPNASYQNTPDLSHTTVQIIDRRIVVSIGLENTTTSITEPRRRHIAQGA